MSDLSSCVSREDLVKSIQSLTGRDDVSLLDGYKVERASSGVEGFNSIVMRVWVSYLLPGEDNVKHHVFFVKGMPQIEYQREVVKTTRIFSKEWLVYSQVVPAMKKISAGRVKVPLPELYHGVYQSDDATFYLEDLVHSGYRAAKRSYLSDGMDLAHCSLVMKGLGRFHALGLAAEKTLDPGKGGWAGSYPILDKDYLFHFPKPGDPQGFMKNLVDNMLQNVKELCREIDGLPKEAEASGTLEKVFEGVWPTLCRLKETPSDGRHVLNHGDCWMNNTMFRYQSGVKGVEEPVDVKFFDLQQAKCSHPSTDLLHFMYFNTRRPIRDKHINSLIEMYHESLTENLKLLVAGSPPISLKDLKSDYMEEYKPYGIIVGMCFSPIMMLGDDFLLPNADDMTSEKIEDFFNTGQTAEIKFRFHNDPKYRSNVEDIVREFVDMALPNGLESVNSSPLLVKK